MDLWERVDELVEQARTASALHSHRLHLYAAWRWRSQGRTLDPELVELERGAAVQRLSAPMVVKLVREAYDGPVILLKGADVAARYPRPELRPSLDVDLLVPDAAAAHSALIGHGFRECGDTFESHHHLPTLEWPGLLTRVDVHGTPSWPTWLTPPSTEELFAASTDESVLGSGILTPPEPYHALLVTAHMWREVPMTRLGQLLDVCLLAEGVEPDELRTLARRWRMGRVWETTESAARRIFLGEDRGSVPSRIWTRRLEAARERTVIESKLSQILAPFWGLRPPRALVASTRIVASNLQPEADETWGAMIRRTTGALRQSLGSRAARDQTLESEARRQSEG